MCLFYFTVRKEGEEPYTDVSFPQMAYPDDGKTAMMTFVREMLCTYVFVAIILICKDARTAATLTGDAIM